MKEELITYKTAILAKEKGFDIPVKAAYNTGKGVNYFDTGVKNSNLDIKYNYVLSAPTQSLLQRWLREIHNIHTSPMMYINKKKVVKWRFDLTTVSPYYSSIDKRSTKIRDTYEEALEVALYDALNSIDEKYKYDNGLGLLYNS